MSAREKVDGGEGSGHDEGSEAEGEERGNVFRQGREEDAEACGAEEDRGSPARGFARVPPFGKRSDVARDGSKIPGGPEVGA